MKNIRNKALWLVSGLALSGIIFGVATASAATPSTVTSRSGVAHYTVRSDRLNAEATVLGVTPAQLQTELKTTTLKKLISNKGMTMKTFRQQVMTQVHSQLLSQGYSQSQVSKVLSRSHHPEK